MSWDGCGMVGFPAGCVRSSAFGVVFSKVAFLLCVEMRLNDRSAADDNRFTLNCDVIIRLRNLAVSLSLISRDLDWWL